MHAPQISCCFSGYRPGKLPWGNDENDPRCRALKARLRDVMLYQISLCEANHYQSL